jgi:hypothetical protein
MRLPWHRVHAKSPRQNWLVDWCLVTIMDNTIPPRNPTDDEDEDEEDEKDEDRNDGPAVIREPDDDE